MGKSIEDRKSLGMRFTAIVMNPDLKKAPYKPGLQSLFDKYEKNIEAYEDGIGKRKAVLAKLVDNIFVVVDTLKTTTTSMKAERDKDHAANIEMFNTSESELKAAKAEGEKDPTKLVAKLKDFIAKLKKGVEQDKVHADKKEKLGADVDANLKKIGDIYEKEAKAIEAETKRLTTVGNTLEGQMSALLKTNIQIAAKQKNDKLKNELGESLSVLLQS